MQQGFQTVGLDHLDRAERLLGRVGQVPLRLATAQGGRRDPSRVAGGGDREGHYRHDHDHGQQRVQEHHDHDHDQQGQGIGGHRQAGGDGHLLHAVDVGDETLNGVRAAVAGVELLGEPLDVVEGAAAQGGRRARTDQGEGHGGQVVAPRPARHEHQEDHAQPHQGGDRGGCAARVPAHGGHQRVDDDLQGPGLQHPEGHFRQKHHRAPSHETPLRRGIGPYQAQGLTHGGAVRLGRVPKHRRTHHRSPP